MATSTLRCARRPAPGAGVGGDGWVFEDVAEEVVTNGTSISLDPSGGVHVVYRDETTPMWARRAPDGTWTRETIVVSESAGAFAALAVDAAGVPHVTFQGELTGVLWHAWRSAGPGGWMLEELDQFGFLGLNLAGTAIVADGEALRVGYYHSDLGDLRLAERPAGGTWAVSTVDEMGDVGRSAAIATDATSAIHLAYWDRTAPGGTWLSYARRTDGAWTYETIAPANGEEGALSIATAPSGSAHVTWHDAAKNDLVYAVRCP